MPRQYTKNLIKNEFIKLLEEMSFKDITIALLAERCDINRNTFYYHYEDIYSLVRDILNDEIEKVDNEFDISFSMEKSILHAASFLLDNKTAAQNLFESIDKNEKNYYLYKICDSVISKYVENECEIKNINARNEDKTLIIDFYRAAFVGLLDQWIQDGMKERPDRLIYRIGDLFDGNIESSLRMSEKLDKLDPFEHN